MEDRSPKPNRVWNRIPDDVRVQILDLALNEPELSPRELAVRFTDSKGYFVPSSTSAMEMDAIQSDRPDRAARPIDHRANA